MDCRHTRPRGHCVYESVDIVMNASESVFLENFAIHIHSFYPLASPGDTVSSHRCMIHMEESMLVLHVVQYILYAIARILLLRSVPLDAFIDSVSAVRQVYTRRSCRWPR
jgi:hypothetical protein